MKKQDIVGLYPYVGDTSQLFYAKEYRYCGGRADGMRAVDIDNGQGLTLTVNIDRCMDIGRLAYRSVNCAHVAKNGSIAPAYYDANDAMRTFTAGFLTTCGLKNVGPAETVDDCLYPTHGGVGNVPAEGACISTEPDCEHPHIRISGTMRQADFLGDNLLLHRELRVMLDSPTVEISDTIENRGFSPVPVMLLYHFNIGYPLLAGGTKFITSGRFLRSRDTVTERDIAERCDFPEPIVGYHEQVFYYRPTAAEGVKSFAALVNDELDMAAVVWCDPSELPMMSNWKNPAAGDYVMGIEPANCMVQGITKQRQCGVEILAAQDKKAVNLTVELAQGKRLARLKELANT